MKNKLLVGVFLSAAFLNGVAHADLIGFNASFDGGVISWDGKAGDPLIGTGIGITSVTGTGTKANPGTFAVTGGDLNFSTGGFLGATTGAAGQIILDFGAGGSFNITGGVPAAKIPAGSPLLTGYFTGTSTFDALLGVFGTTNGGGVDFLGGSLSSFFGIAPSPYAFTATLGSIQTPLFSVGPFAGIVTSVKITDPPLNNSPVPEPASIVLTSLVLLGCTTIVRRHRVNR